MTTATRKADLALISRLRDQLAAATRTIDELQAEVAQLHRLINEGNQCLTLDDFCHDCAETWARCECDDE